MPLPTKNGRYLATPSGLIIEPKASGTVQVQLDFACTAFLNGGAEEPCIDGEQIRGWFTIINKDGKPNTINVDSIRDALGWDGGFAELAALDLADKVVQIVVGDRVGQDGVTRKDVKYLNPRDYAGGKGPGTTDAGTVQDLDAKFGAMLRAMAPKASGGAKTPTTPARHANATVVDAGAQGKELAYREMMLKVNAYNRERPTEAVSTEDANKAFKDMFEAQFPGKRGADMTPADWVTFRNFIKNDFSPATLSLIPF